MPSRAFGASPALELPNLAAVEPVAERSDLRVGMACSVAHSATSND